MMNKLVYMCSLAVAVMFVTTIQAQERAAVGDVETQMSWAALSSKINATNTNVTALGSQITQITVCGKKGMVYVPGAGDAQGCTEAGMAGNPAINITNLNNRINTVTNTANSAASTANSAAGTASGINSSLNNGVYACANQGKLFNGSGCVAVAKPTCTLSSVSSGSTSNRNGTTPSACPSGYTVTGDSGGSTNSSNICTRVTCN